MWKLVIEDDEGKRTVVPLSRDDYTIGRQEGNTIRLTERNVSRAHGCVRRNRAASGGHVGQVFVLEDLRSYNGLFVNGLRVAHTQDLQHGDLIQIGDYRIVLQDDAAAAVESAAIPVTVDPTDAKETIPITAGYRGQTLTERPNRLVMLVGPTPGVEYPLDRERLTVGRAEDATISVNHNSVSRLHCEIHALGDGRFEIVDKGSSNGVRVNAVELRRSIIEAGDVIELGDVRFKFVGAGQIFVPGPNESQQLTAISDRDAELANGKKGFGAYALPVLGAGILGAAIIVALAWVLKYRNMQDPADGGVINAADIDQSVVLAARASCSMDDCEASHATIAALPETSPWKDSSESRAVLQMWAESLLRKARVDPDLVSRRATLSRVLADVHVDPTQKKQASDLFDPANAAQQDPSGMRSDAGGALPVTASPPVPGKPTPTSHLQITNATAAAPATTPTPSTKATATSTASTLDKALDAGRRGDNQTVRTLLETKVRSGHGTAEEANLVKQACKQMSDKACTEDIKAKYP